MKTFITMMGAGLLVLSSVTVSDARQHARQQQSGADSYRSDYNNTRDNRDSSCFSGSTGIPTERACSAGGG
jgi:hypothetical protein